MQRDIRNLLTRARESFDTIHLEWRAESNGPILAREMERCCRAAACRALVVLALPALGCRMQRPGTIDFCGGAPTSRYELSIAFASSDVIALGDTARLIPMLTEWRCDAGYSRRLDAADFVWRASAPDTLSVISAGRVVGRATGRAAVSATPKDSLTQPAGAREEAFAHLTILPAVAALRWEPHAVTLRVGERRDFRAIAYDRLGRVVTTVPYAGSSPSDSGTISVERLAETHVYVVTGRRPGTVRLLARLGHRADSASITIVPAGAKIPRP